MKRKILIACAAAASIIPAQLASAQSCIKRQDLSDTVVFAMPLAYSAFAKKCSGVLAKDGFVNSEGDEFIAKYSALQDSAWPGTYSFFQTFMNKNSKDSKVAALFGAMEPKMVQSFFGVVLEEKLQETIKIEDCRKIERLIEPLAPLPPENAGALLVEIVSLAKKKSPSNQFQICTDDPQ